MVERDITQLAPGVQGVTDGPMGEKETAALHELATLMRDYPPRELATLIITSLGEAPVVEISDRKQASLFLAGVAAAIGLVTDPVVTCSTSIAGALAHILAAR